MQEVFAIFACLLVDQNNMWTSADKSLSPNLAHKLHTMSHSFVSSLHTPKNSTAEEANPMKNYFKANPPH